MNYFVDVHSHVTPFALPDVPGEASRSRWPCLRCQSADKGSVYIGETLFREIDARSWDADRRIEDMDRDRIAMEVLSPMPELLSYWLEPGDAALLCDANNHHIADLIAHNPRRFRGLGAVPLQDPVAAARALPRLRSEFGLSGVEIGSNINGMLLGDEMFDPLWEAAEGLGMAIFVHALHPVAAKAIIPAPFYVPFALFPMDVAMTAASFIMAGVIEQFPGLRIGFSHGGGALASILGRLDTGWSATGGFKGRITQPPSQAASKLFYDSNVYDQAYLKDLVQTAVPGRVFAGTDYPYDIMQKSPVEFVERAGLTDEALADVCVGTASLFLAEDLSVVIGN